MMNLYKLLWRAYWESKPPSLEKAYLLAPSMEAALLDARESSNTTARWDLISITRLDRNISSAKGE